MKLGTVVGPIVATKRLWQTPQGALLKIELEGRAQLVALDTLGCGKDERVLVVEGSAAAAWFHGEQVPVDALIIAAVEKE